MTPEPETPPGFLRLLLDESPHLVDQLRDARIVIAINPKGGQVHPFFGEKLYAAEGGLATVRDVGRFEAGVSERNPFPPGTWAVCVDIDTDDLDTFIEVVERARGPIRITTDEARARIERN